MGILTVILIHFHDLYCAMWKNIEGFGVLSLPEIPKQSLVVVVFDQSIDLLCLYNTNNSFQLLALFLIEKPSHAVGFSGAV